MASSRQSTLISLALIAILGFAVYANALNGAFVWDDNALVRDAEYIRSWRYVPKFFTENIGAGVGHRYAFYRPVQMLTYAADYSLWRLDVRGYHLTNILLHILAALCVYRLIRIIFGDRLLSLFTALFFVVHPVHTGAVASISGRADPLAAVLSLSCFILYLKNAQGFKLWRCILMVVSFALAILSRESSLILPALLLLYHYAFRKKIEIRLFLPIAALAAVYIILRVGVFQMLMPHKVSSTTILQRLPLSFAALAGYIRLLILPFNLHMVYESGDIFWHDPKVLAGVAILALSAFLLFKNKRSDTLIFFAIAWFFIALLPQSNIYPLNAYMAEHWLYLPSIGFFLVLAKFLVLFHRDNRILSIGALTLLLAFFSILTISQNNYWNDAVTFYKKTLEYVPNSSWMYNNLGNVYYYKGRSDDAIDSYKRAIEIKPDFESAHYNLANAYNATGNKKEAALLLEKAIKLNPHYAHAYNNLGVIYHDLGRDDDAITVYKKAVDLKPDFADAYYNMANAYYYIGEVETAAALFKDAVRIDPYHANAYHNLATLYMKAGRTDDAESAYKRSLEADPKHMLSQKNLSVLYFKKGEYTLAIKHCDRAMALGIKMNPEFLKALAPHRKRR